MEGKVTILKRKNYNNQKPYTSTNTIPVLNGVYTIYQINYLKKLTPYFLTICGGISQPKGVQLKGVQSLLP